jgi:MYXO-CTERM domain-containing protein
VVIDHTTNVDGSVKPAVPITAIAVAAAAVVLGIVLWRRRTR